MPPKYLHVFSEENQELQKQIGCMSGLFQMFDRHHLLTGRRLGGHSHKRLPSGHSVINNGSIGAERSGGLPQIFLEKNLSRSSHENQRVSMESSQTSFSSSSCSSSFSSLECNKSTQEPPSFERTIFPERSFMNSPNLNSSKTDAKPSMFEPHCDLASARPRRQSLDFRDVVKDSIYKDARCLSVKTSTKEDVKGHKLKHRDSPRPMPLSKSMDGSYIIGIDGKSKMPMDLNESLRVLVKLKEAPWYFSEDGEPPRSSYEAKDATLYPVARETPRFSYDGREISRTSLDSRENSKPVSRLKELPRLSLDSRSSTFESKPNSILKDLDSIFVDQRVPRAVKLQQEPGSQSHLPSVVAKLMGLEAMPHMSLASQKPVDTPKPIPNKDIDAINGQKNSIVLLNPQKAAQNSKDDQLTRSPKTSLKGPSTPKLKSQDPVMKPVSNSRITIETAPWSQQDKVRAAPKAAFRYWEGHLKPQNESVYSEIEKRLKDLEFQQSSKDLRALKQILDAMQAKGLLESKKGENQYAKVSGHKKSTDRTLSDADESLSTRRNPTLVKRSATSRGFQSPIVIMKPAKSIQMSGVSASSVIPLEGLSSLPKLKFNDTSDRNKASVTTRMMKDQTPKGSTGQPATRLSLSTDRKSNNWVEDDNSQRAGPRMTQNSARSQQTHRDSSCSSVKTMSSVSPRLQQRKHEAEKKSQPPLPSSDSNKPPRQSANRQQPDSMSPRNKLRRKPTQTQRNNEQLSDTSNLSRQGDEMSGRSDSSISLASQIDVEVTSAARSAEMNNVFYQQGSRTPSGRAANNAGSVVRQKELSHSLNKDVSTLEVATVALEQPSPISVLDDSFYQDDLPPSPAKKLSNAVQDNKSRTWDKHCKLTSIDKGTPLESSSEINQKKLEKIENLVQKLRQLSSTSDETMAIDHIASLCETQNPDHRYVSEILLASGLLMKDLSSGPMSPMPIQLHPSGHPINPDLFLVLEQTKSGWFPEPVNICESTPKPKPDPKKLHRKLVFDVVNEILVQKLELTSSGPHTDSSFRVKKLAGKLPSGQQLLRELCSEIDQLQAGSFDEDNAMASEELLRQSEGWEDFGREVPGLVLEIERLVFKDLIDEVLRGEIASSLQAKSSRLRRQLFAK